MEEKKIKDKPIYTAAKVPKSTFSTWKTSLKNPDSDTLPEIAEILGVSLNWLITGTEPEISQELEPKEQQLINYYRTTNLEGQSRILEQAELMALKYPKPESSSKYKIG